MRVLVLKFDVNRWWVRSKVIAGIRGLSQIPILLLLICRDCEIGQIPCPGWHPDRVGQIAASLRSSQ